MSSNIRNKLFLELYWLEFVFSQILLGLIISLKLSIFVSFIDSDILLSVEKNI